MTKLRTILPPMVYGGSDGAITTFSVMAGAAGAGLDPRIIIILGFANLASDGISMASSDFLSEESRAGSRQSKSLFQAIVTFLSFVIGGAIPLVPFLLALFITLPANQFFLSTLLTLFAFVGIGYIRSRVLRRKALGMILQSVSIGTLCAIVSYFTAHYIATIVIG